LRASLDQPAILHHAISCKRGGYAYAVRPAKLPDRGQPLATRPQAALDLSAKRGSERYVQEFVSRWHGDDRLVEVCDSSSGFFLRNIKLKWDTIIGALAKRRGNGGSVALRIYLELFVVC
jgi:hypothetical protein